MAAPLECAADSDCGMYASCDSQTQLCRCDPLWSTNADFYLNQECALSIVGIYILWAVNLALLLWVGWKCAFIVLARIENFLEQRRKKKDYKLWTNKGLIAVIVYFGLCYPAHFIMCVAHLAGDPTMRVGFDLLPTMCFFLAKIGLYVSSMFLQGPFLASTLKSFPLYKSLVNKNYFSNVALSCMSIFLGCLPLIIYGSFQSVGFLSSQIAILEFYYFVQGAVLGLNAVQAYIIRLLVFKRLDAARKYLGNQDQTQSMKAKISAFQDVLIRQGLIQMVVYVLMGAIPFFLNKHAYFLPLSWLIMPILGKNLAFQINLDKGNTRSLMERFGIKRTGTGTGTGTSGKDSSNAAANTKREAKPGSRTRMPDGTFIDSVNPLSAMSVVSPSDFDSSTPARISARLGPGSPTKMSSSSKKKKAERANSSVHSSSTARSFADLISSNSDLRQQFEAFVRSKYASEGLSLLDMSSEFHHLGKNPKTSQKKLDQLGKMICEKHLMLDSPHGVDMPAALIAFVLDQYKARHFERNAFDAIRGVAFHEIKDNFYFAFLQKTGVAEGAD